MPQTRYTIAGIDLAWGERMPDGVCLACWQNGKVEICSPLLTRGDQELLEIILPCVTTAARALCCVDAPLICPNIHGSRPVDRLTHVHFRKQHAGCHPANSTKCPRPPRIRALLEDAGYVSGWDFVRHGAHLVAEVYPHPAMVRMFGLARIVKYKRGPVQARRLEFKRAQNLMVDFLATHFPKATLETGAQAVLCDPWTKPVEDKFDALMCAVIGLWHVAHGGQQTEVLGDLETGFILIPTDVKSNPANQAPRPPPLE